MSRNAFAELLQRNMRACVSTCAQGSSCVVIATQFRETLQCAKAAAALFAMGEVTFGRCRMRPAPGAMGNSPQKYAWLEDNHVEDQHELGSILDTMGLDSPNIIVQLIGPCNLHPSLDELREVQKGVQKVIECQPEVGGGRMRTRLKSVSLS